MFTIDNNYARSHMAITGSYSVRSHFTTDLDGSGQIVAVADSGLDEDHGDFGTRIIESKDVIGDGSTADTWSGHGTHVACTVLGDGTRGPYAGVAPAAEFISRRWKMIIPEILYHLHSIICSMMLMEKGQGFIQIHGDLLRLQTKGNTHLNLKM